jgi:hypothetical protein
MCQINFASLWRYKAKYPKFDAALRTARKQAVGKGRKVGEVRMIQNVWGETVPDTECICDEPRRMRLIQYRLHPGRKRTKDDVA